MLNKNLTNKIMKNVHVLPTEKPSRVYLIKSNNRLGITSDNPEFTENFGSGTQNQNIYITSDEEIKNGDWVYCLREGLEPILKQKVNTIGVNNDEMMKKIIITTDQDLIKDGVQAIDDKFLEWFVKNPSCEFVEIKLIKDSEDHPEISGGYKEEWEYYEIIIPKEELSTKLHKGEVVDESYPKDFRKEETLEEAAEKYSKKSSASVFQEAHKRDFIAGAKWQAERMYSEEEVENILIEYVKTNPTKPYRVVSWFQQIKKK